MDLQIKKNFTNNSIIKGNVIKEHETIECDMSRVIITQNDNKKSDIYQDYNSNQIIYSESELSG